MAGFEGFSIEVRREVTVFTPSNGMVGLFIQKNDQPITFFSVPSGNLGFGVAVELPPAIAKATIRRK